MSLSTASSTDSSYAAANPGSGSGVMRALGDMSARLGAGVGGVGGAVGNAASATVSFSARAMQALADGGKAVLLGVEDVVEFPFEMAADAVVGTVHAVEGGLHMIGNGVHAAIDGMASLASGVESAAHAVVVDLPEAIASQVSDVADAAMDDATSVAGTAVGVMAMSGTAGAKLVSALI